jgi:hypothetical protein
MDRPSFQLLEIEGVWSLVYLISCWCASDRNSEFVEALDLVRAIYIVDLEHVADYWSNWEGYEGFVAKIMLAHGRPAGYVNRTMYLLQTHLAARENPGQFIPLGRPSKALYEIVMAAKQLAHERTANDEPPSSRDFLFCTCAQDPVLSAALQQSGLRMDKLSAAVGKPGFGDKP